MGNALSNRYLACCLCWSALEVVECRKMPRMKPLGSRWDDEKSIIWVTRDEPLITQKLG